jgi:hypothetical protein
MQTHLIVIGIIATCCGCSVRKDLPPSAATTGPIPLADVRERGIEGSLGVPLGTVVTIRGTAVDGWTALKQKEYQSDVFARVETVNERRLPEPVLVRLKIEQLTIDKVDLPKPGAAVDFVGWETGGYDGIIFAPNVNIGQGLQYSFGTHFVIAKRNN